MYGVGGFWTFAEEDKKGKFIILLPSLKFCVEVILERMTKDSHKRQ